MSDEQQKMSQTVTVTPGEMLRAAREDLGYDVVYIAQRLCDRHLDLIEW